MYGYSPDNSPKMTSVSQSCNHAFKALCERPFENVIVPQSIMFRLNKSIICNDFFVEFRGRFRSPGSVGVVEIDEMHSKSFTKGNKIF